jgi:hypothetical protein
MADISLEGKRALGCYYGKEISSQCVTGAPVTLTVTVERSASGFS